MGPTSEDFRWGGSKGLLGWTCLLCFALLYTPVGVNERVCQSGRASLDRLKGLGECIDQTRRRCKSHACWPTPYNKASSPLIGYGSSLTDDDDQHKKEGVAFFSPGRVEPIRSSCCLAGRGRAPSIEALCPLNPFQHPQQRAVMHSFMHREAVRRYYSG